MGAENILINKGYNVIKDLRKAVAGCAPTKVSL